MDRLPGHVHDGAQKLELDLKQSYATKNFTLKQGLLDLEKKYRAHIYGHPDMEVRARFARALAAAGPGAPRPLACEARRERERELGARARGVVGCR